MKKALILLLGLLAIVGCKDDDDKAKPATEEYKKAVILPFRAYLLPSARNANPSIPMELENTDGIDTIETIDADGTEHYYDLQGRELPGKPNRGIYIHNGKKVVVK